VQLRVPPEAVGARCLQVLIDECWRGRRWVVETDIASCFSAIPQERLMDALEERICDQPVLKLLRAMLRAEASEDGQVRGDAAGTAQGGGSAPSYATSTCTGWTGNGMSETGSYAVTLMTSS
jgi:hypothetical protein